MTKHKYVWQKANKGNRNHYICEVFDTINPSDSAIYNRYYDGTQAAAIQFFMSLDCFKKYMNNQRYLVTMRGNSVQLNCLNDKE